MPLDPRDHDGRQILPAPALPLPADLRAAEPDADDCLAPADLSALDDGALYALEADRCLVPTEWERVEAELRRRRQSRAISVADTALGAPIPAVTLTLGDLERVTNGLEDRLAARLAEVEARTRALRWWTVAAPLAWALVSLAAWAVLSLGGTTAFTAALLD